MWVALADAERDAEEVQERDRVREIENVWDCEGVRVAVEHEGLLVGVRDGGEAEMDGVAEEVREPGLAVARKERVRVPVRLGVVEWVGLGERVQLQEVVAEAVGGVCVPLRLWVRERLAEGVHDGGDGVEVAVRDGEELQVGVADREGREWLRVRAREQEAVRVRVRVAVALRSPEDVRVRVGVSTNVRDPDADGDGDAGFEMVWVREALRDVRVAVGDGEAVGVGERLGDGVTSALGLGVIVRVPVGVRARDAVALGLSPAVQESVRESEAEAVSRCERDRVTVRRADAVRDGVEESEAVRLRLWECVQVLLGDAVRLRVGVSVAETESEAECVCVCVGDPRAVPVAEAEAVGVPEADGPDRDRLCEAVAEALPVGAADGEALGVGVAVDVNDRDRDGAVGVADGVTLAVVVPATVAEGVPLSVEVWDDVWDTVAEPEAVRLNVRVGVRVNVSDGGVAVTDRDEAEPVGLRAVEPDGVALGVMVDVRGCEAVGVGLGGVHVVVREGVWVPLRVRATEPVGVRVREAVGVGVGVALGLRGCVCVPVGEWVPVGDAVGWHVREGEAERVALCVKESDTVRDHESVAVAE